MKKNMTFLVLLRSTKLIILIVKNCLQRKASTKKEREKETLNAQVEKALNNLLTRSPLRF